MALHRDVDSTDPSRRPDPVTRFEERRASRAGVLATGTLACPRCDAPVAPHGSLAPVEPIGCPFCGFGARVRDFLTLEDPARPARVTVRVVPRA